MARGIQTAVDSADFFVQHTAGQDTRDSSLLVNLTATATGFVGGDQVNTIHKGVMLMVALASISINTATLAVNVNAKRGDGTYFNIARLSLDGLTNGNANSQDIMVVYPGAVSPPNPGNVTAFGIPLPGKMQITTSLTITTSASQSGVVGYSVGQSKVV